MAIVVTGSPGVGKHTVSGIIAQKLGLEIVDINDVARKAGMITRDGEVDVNALRPKFAGVSEKSLIVGHLAPYVLDSKQVSLAIVLRRSPYELEKVYAERDYTHEKQLANLGAEILGIVAHDAASRFGPESTFEIDNTARNSENTAASALSTIDSGKSDSSIDWLEMVSERGDMQRFFSYQQGGV